VLEVEGDPNMSAVAAPEENMLPVFLLSTASLAQAAVDYVFGEEVGTCAETVFEVQPRKDLHLVGYLCLPDQPPMVVVRISTTVESSIRVSGSVGAIRKLQETNIVPVR
jgi:hypothetical protein